ncbi:MAG TPA: hypothetical protein VEC60_01980 [Reyranella sp.]|nr:hypothetical protein [Reyranella sp.]
MTQCTWTEVVDDPAARHLVVARLERKACEEPAPLLGALIDRLDPVGHYALLTRCEEQGPVVLCAFTHPEDAHALATAIEAVECEEYAEWGSRCHFTLCRSAARAIVDALEASPPPAPAPAYAVTYPA